MRGNRDNCSYSTTTLFVALIRTYTLTHSVVSRLCFAASLTLLHSKIKRINTLRLGGKRKIDQSLSGWKARACWSIPTEEQEDATAEEKVDTAKEHTKNKRPPTPRNGIRMV